MNLQIQELATGPAPTASLIVLHGLGADGSDFVPVCRAMGLGAKHPAWARTAACASCCPAPR